MKLSSLRIKISAAIMVTVFFISLSIAALLYPFEKERRHTHLKNIHVLLTAVFNQKEDQIANEIYADQKEALVISLKELKKIEKISHILLYNTKGQVMTSTGPGADILKLFATIDLNAIESAAEFSRLKYMENHYANFFSPIEVIGVHVGYIRILYSLNAFEKESQMVVFFFGILFFVLLVIIICLNMFLSHCVILPTSRLRDAMGQLQTGELGTQVSISSRDEIGQMASAFNEMSQMLYEQKEKLTRAITAKDTYALKLKKSNAALELLNKNLETRVRERTAELSKSNRHLQEEIDERQRAYREKRELEKRLDRSKKMETLGLLAGGVAHDLNNVLSGIVSYPDLLLLDLSPDDPGYGPIMTIKNSGQKAAAIVQDLLTLTRRGVICNEVVNVNAIISEYFTSPEHQRLILFHSNITVEVLLQEDLFNIQGSPLHLKKTVMNLVSNAAEAQPDGGSIQVSTYNRYVDKPIQGYQLIKEGDYVILEVKDHGMGISEHDREKIFEPFYTKKIMGRSGTGLGMAVVWGTIQDHRGYINIKSELNRGTTFELFFPITRKHSAKQEDIPSLASHMGNRERILIIDDVKEQVEIATMILKKLNYTPVSVSSGEKAVKYLESHCVDLLILDMIMAPGMDGLETYKKIIETHPGQKALIVSGYAENHRVKTLQQLGAGPYIKKPYTIEKLGRAIKDELLRREPI
ncbi:HAMP domain-containing protein [Desulfocicer vacuolatum DSM 3385]|uniref:histidine kinase n=1 Tax=Desulfocicer vacuolatum DSM 3385 TaxID=1121400 RepID=A0A1W2DF78_9BACT|nr:ATP-binding protein [Desulfocicer vacuolatum]SMC96209.1 HAMP domain-containing protein [Desulfocicer vacuolatum DSM 3385]